MKISEIIQPKISSTINSLNTQDIVPQDIASEECVSAIAEGITQIFRRGAKGKGLKTGFRCTSGVRRGRIVAKASTCNAKLNPSKGVKISRKRHQKAHQTGMKASFTKRTSPASRRLRSIQVGHKRSRSDKVSKITPPKHSKKK
jgi:hypothetical protein